MIRSTLHEDSVGDIVAAGFEGAAEDIVVVNPSRETIREVVDVLDGLSDRPSVRMIAPERPLKDVMEDFLVASTVADLIAEGSLAIRTRDDLPNNSLLVSSDTVVSIVTGGSKQAGISTSDGEFVQSTREFYDTQWEEASTFTLRTPPMTHIRETLVEEIGQETATDFDRVLDSLDSARGNGEGLGEVTISLLVAARNGELLYEISNWGEDVGLASKATFSRTKTTLEEKGLLDTEKVPIDIGRPRLRLVLGDERLEEADVDELADVARRLLAT